MSDANARRTASAGTFSPAINAAVTSESIANDADFACNVVAKPHPELLAFNSS